MPNKLSQFWQELKRRNVVRVITVYAASAFVILELVDILAPSLGLPTWTLNLVLILLIVGFFIAVIVSWIYDIHPEEGIVKTESIQDAKSGGSPAASNGWKIASYISFAVIVLLIVLNLIPPKGKNDILEKSIAVLPFRNDSPDQENDYFINGTMESILNNLAKISDLRVVSRSSVERYRDSMVNIPAVAEFLNVSYILEGSMQKYGDQIRMSLQLINRNDQHVWSEQYDRKITTVEENLSLQSEIAKLVAGELMVVISPQEQELIEKMITTNSFAYEFYQRGMNEYWNNTTIEGLKNAETMFRYALEYDSTFALAYVGLAKAYIPQYFDATYFSENFMDSVIVLAEIALNYDNELADAYELIADINRYRGNTKKAIEGYDKAIALNPNAGLAYFGKARTLTDEDLVNSIRNAYKAASIHRGPVLPSIYRFLGFHFFNVGYLDRGLSYYEEALRLDGDSSIYYNEIADLEWTNMNFSSALNYSLKAYQYDTSNLEFLENLADYYMTNQQYQKGLEMYRKYINRKGENLGVVLGAVHRIAYSFWVNGYKEEALKYFRLHEELCLETTKLGRAYSETLFLNYDLAGIYAFLGEREKAYANLRIFCRKEIIPLWLLTEIKIDPLFRSIRNEPEFQQIVRDMETKYQAETERVRQWLEENDML